MNKIIILGLSSLVVFAATFSLAAHQLEIKGELQNNKTGTNMTQNLTIDKSKIKENFYNAIGELDNENMVGVHQQIELVEQQLDTIPQIQSQEQEDEIGYEGQEEQEDEGF